MKSSELRDNDESIDLLSSAFKKALKKVFKLFKLLTLFRVISMLKISTTPALIGINTSAAKTEIQQPKPDVSMHTEHPKLEIKNELPKVLIDQYECFAEAGLKNFIDLTRETAQLSKKAAMQGIERRVNQGNQMRDIHKKINPIAQQAVYNAFEQFKKEFSLGTVPKSRPKIELKEGKPQIKVREGRVDFDVKVNRPIINYSSGNVEIYLRQKNSIDIEYVGKEIDKKV